MSDTPEQDSDEADKKAEAERVKQLIDIYKIRIEAHDRNYFSLRDLEWRTALQFLSGYIAIGAGYHQLRGSGSASPLLLWWSIALTLLLYLTFLFFRLCIHQRLTWARDRGNEFIRKMHELHPDTKNANEEHYTPRGAYWYALATQIAVHTLTAATAIVFIYATRNGAPVR